MKKSLLSALAILSLGLSSASYAGCSGIACSGKITKLYVQGTGSGHVYIGMDGDEKSLNCTAVSNVYMTLPKDAVNHDLIYSTLLAARAAGKSATVRITEGSSNCKVQYVTF